MIREATDQEIAQWDKLIEANPDGGHFLQSREWAEFKLSLGWKPLYKVYEHKGLKVAILVYQRTVRGLGTVWYISKGPGVTSQHDLYEVVDALVASKPKAFLLKVEPELDVDDVDLKRAATHKIVKPARNVQLKATIMVDLRPSEEEILAGFKQKARYNIRLSARKGVTVKPVDPTPQNIDTVYNLITSVHERAHFFFPARSYFEEYWRILTDSGHGQFFVAEHEGEPIAAAFIIQMGKHAWYKDGGSTRNKRELMAPHLMQWEIMRWAKERGAESYDLLGSPTRDALDGSHPLHSLYQFKSGFNEHITEFAGTLDVPLNDRKYQLWTGGLERATLAVNSRRKHNLWY